MIIKIVSELTKGNSEAEQKIKSNFAQYVLSIVQVIIVFWYNSQNTSTEDEALNEKAIDSKHVKVIPRGLLEKNIGVPFMVICTNTETMVVACLPFEIRPNPNNLVKAS